MISKGLKPGAIRNEADAVQRLSELLPLRGVVEPTTRSKLAAEYLAGYCKIAGLENAPISDVHVIAAQDLWQYHTVITLAKAHSAALPGKTFLAQCVFDAGKGKTPHAADVSPIFGVNGQFDTFPKGTFEGITAVVQAVVGAFVRSGNPSNDAATFTAYDAAHPKMTTLDGPAGAHGCKVVDTKAECDALYDKMVAKLRAAEK